MKITGLQPAHQGRLRIRSYPGAGYEEAVSFFAGEFNPIFLKRHKSPIQRRLSKISPNSTLGKLTVGTASTVRKNNRYKNRIELPS